MGDVYMYKQVLDNELLQDPAEGLPEKSDQRVSVQALHLLQTSTAELGVPHIHIQA